METVHGRESTERPRQLPEHVLTIASLPDPGAGNALHPQQATIVALANLTAIRDSLYHFQPPQVNAEPEMYDQQFHLEQVDNEYSNFSVAVSLLEHALKDMKVVEFGPFEQRDCYDQSLRNLAASLPFIERYDAFFLRTQEQRFPTYPGNGSGQEQFDGYEQLILAYRQATAELENSRPEFASGVDNPVELLKESAQLLPTAALLGALHLVRAAHSEVLNPDRTIEDPGDRWLRLAFQSR